MTSPGLFSQIIMLLWEAEAAYSIINMSKKYFKYY